MNNYAFFASITLLTFAVNGNPILDGRLIVEKTKDQARQEDDVCAHIIEHYRDLEGHYSKLVQDCIVVGNAAFYKIDEYASWSRHQSWCQSYNLRSNLASVFNFREEVAVRSLVATEEARFGTSGSVDGPARKWIGLYDCGTVGYHCWLNNERVGWGQGFSRIKFGYWSHNNRCGFIQVYQEKADYLGNEHLGFYESWRTTSECNLDYQGICRFDI